MKKLLSVLLCVVLLFSITACGSSNYRPSEERDTTESESVTEPETIETTEETETKIAVVCFSGTGNTMAVAETIADVTGSDLFEIIPADKWFEAAIESGIIK